MNYLSRAAWGAQDPKRDPTSWRYVSGVAVHWEGGGTVNPNPTDQQFAASMRSIQSYHMGKAYNDIAYNWCVALNGRIAEGRGWDAQSGANGTTDANAHFVAICVIAGGDNQFTDAAKRSVVELIRETQSRFPLASDVRPHSSFTSTDCPGPEIRSWVLAGCPVGVPGPSPSPSRDESLMSVVWAPGAKRAPGGQRPFARLHPSEDAILLFNGASIGMDDSTPFPGVRVYRFDGKSGRPVARDLVGIGAAPDDPRGVVVVTSAGNCFNLQFNNSGVV